jgi:hypothetical protein
MSGCILGCFSDASQLERVRTREFLFMIEIVCPQLDMALGIYRLGEVML